MPISFAQIPSNIKVPLYWVEVDPSMAGLPTLNLRALMVGTMSSEGTALPDVPIAIGSVAQAQAQFGIGSELTRMFQTYFKNNFANEVWAGPVAASANSVAATGTITVATPPTDAGTIHLYIGGIHVPVNVGGTDTAAEVAQAIVDACTADLDLAVEAAIVAMKVSAAAVAVGGTGYVVNDTINLANGVVLKVATVTSGAVATVTIVSPGGIPTSTPPTGPQPQLSTSGVGTGATFTLTWTAGSTSAVVLTAAFMGVNGNDIYVMTDYYGQIGGETLPNGLTLTLPATGFLTGGVGVPAFTNLISSMGEVEYEYVAMPYTDSTSLLAWESEYGFEDTGRWGWMRQHFGHVFSSKRGDYNSLLNFGMTRNSGVVSIMAFEQTTPSPMFEYAAAYTAKAQRALANDPARPLQTLQLMGTLPAPFHQRFNFDEINALASSGLAIQKCWPGSGMTQIAREQTTYQLNSYGQPDDAYELVTTLATLAKLLRNQRQAITSKYPRSKLADDGTKFGPGQVIVTPGIAKAELVAQYRNDEFDGLVENTAQFKNFLLVERDSDNPNRLNVLYPPDLINQLRIFAVLAQFRLQYDRGVDTAIVGFTGLSGVAGAGGALTGAAF
jgi:phage tail sheath gpL-like